MDVNEFGREAATRLSGAPRVAWYRFTATWSRRRSGYLGIVLLVALVGGLAMGAVAAARRTQSSYPVYIASTDPSDLNGITDFFNGAPGAAGLGYDPARLAAIARLPHVESVQSFAGINTVPLRRNGVPISVPGFPAEGGEGAGILGHSLAGGLGVSVIQGRLPVPAHPDEFLVTVATASNFDLHVGEVVPFGVYTNAQTEQPDFGTARVRPHSRFLGTLVGIVLTTNEVVQDDVDVANDNLFLFSAALTRPLLTCCTAYTPTSVLVADPGRYDTAVQRAISSVLPPGFPPFATNTVAQGITKAERAIKPESIALGVFGGIAALAALLIGAQMISRQLRLGADDLDTLRALGATPTMTAGDGLLGVLGAVLAGSLLAAGVAVALSPLAPLGPARQVYPDPGVSFDWTVLGLGLAVLVIGLAGAAMLLGLRVSPHRAVRRRARSGERHSAVARRAAIAGLPPTAVTGIRFALEPGSGRNAVPVRSAIFGAALAVIIVVATVTFGASLNTLVSHPALYGWNWSYELSAGEGANLPAAPMAKLLDADHQVAAWTAIGFTTIEIDGQPEPILAVTPRATVAPPLLSGHGVDGTRQIVLGATTLAQLHKRVGDTVTVRTNRQGGPTTVRIVGTATLPTIGTAGNVHPEMGTGALVARAIIPVPPGQPAVDDGPNAVLVRLRDNTPAALRSLQRIARATTNPTDDGVTVYSVLRPAEIVNYRSMGTIPAFLGGGLAAGAVVALGLTLVASVRRRRRELAALKTLGFTGRQLAATVAWQSSVAVAIGTVVGVPLGIIVGRTLWDLFARDIDVVPVPSVPVLLVVLIALGALVLANVVAAVPGWSAARTPTGLLLRAE
jgi:hypothetical protein